MRLSYGKGEIHIGSQGVLNGCAGSFNRVHRDYHGRDKVVWRAWNSIIAAVIMLFSARDNTKIQETSS